MAYDIDHVCFPFCDDHHDFHDHDFNHHDFLIDNLDDIDDIDEAFVEVDNCEFAGFDGDEAVFVCPLIKFRI